MALTRVTSGGIAPGVEIKFNAQNQPAMTGNLPAVSFEGDTDTGMYQSAANEISFATAGIKRFTIGADGKLKTYRDATDTDGSIVGGTNPDFDNATNIMLYVNQSDLNSTDSISNTGGNVNSPFKTIERALLEAARRSYVADTGSSNPGAGGDHENDKFEAYTIMVMPGDYTVDNRPGVIGTSNLTFGTFEQELYKFNPKNGGIIVPRGTSIVGYDLRKTVIRPRFVPNPASTLGADVGDQVGQAYQSNSTTLDAANMIEKARGFIVEQAFLAADAQFPSVLKINSKCQRDIGIVVDAWIADLREGGNSNTFIAGERYTNGVALQHVTGTNEKTATLWAIDYAMTVAIKAAHAFGAGYTHTPVAGSTIPQPTITAGIDYTVGADCSGIDTGLAVLGGAISGPSTVTSDGVFATILNNPDTYTALVEKTPGVYERTAIFKVTGGCYFWQMTFKDAQGTPAESVTYSGGVPTFTNHADAEYSHHRVVSFTYADQRTVDGELATYYKKIDHWDTTLDGGNARAARREEFEIVGNRTLSTTIDTVNGCSPYIFNCSLRSVFGLCGMHTDGSKVSEKSFKSMVVAQFTGISLQRDGNAFWQPKDPEGDPNNATYNDPTGTTNPPIYADPDAQYRPSWRHFHIKATDGAFIQVVSVFAVGYADQFLSESGGDMSITNSNSNFGQISLRAKGSQAQSFAPAAQGKITAIIPPRGISSTEATAEFYAIDYNTTWQKNGQGDKNYNQGFVSTFTSNQNKFRLYLDIGGLNSEADIPELIVDSFDHTTNSTVTKRFLNFGSNNNYNLFRDYYSTTGVAPVSEAQIQTIVETEDGGTTPYTARIAVVGETTAEISGQNSERQGYFWDSTVNRIYVKVDSADGATVSFLNNFVFATTTEAVFTTNEVTNPDGSISIVTGTSNITVLQYFDGFPSTLQTSKFIDGRASSPSDLLWRVEYTIPKGSQTIPKPPEKRFIIKGTRLGNDGSGMPYTDFRFQVFDVEEVTSWEYNVRDGVYYLTIIRSDVNTFMYGTSNNSETITRRPLEKMNDQSVSFTVNTVEGLNLFDKNCRVSSNINYLYPSINEEGPTYDIRRIWNPPQSDSRVLVEAIGGGKRVKDLSVPNAAYFYSGNAATPFKEVPSLTSVTAEACHRLVHALDLSYADFTASANVTPEIAPVLSWDSRSGYGDYTTSNVNVYGNGNYRRGINGLLRGISSTVSQNIFGVDGEANERRLVVVERNKSYTAPSETNTVSITNCAPTVPLFRPSILRASSHTWEYVGLGSGNYSTGFPNLQTRVLKPYEQFIAQGYENAGGFVASSGTNSNGDFYIGSQVVQAGGTTTITLNVPKVRKSSESNYVDISNLENRISNAVVNVTATTAKNSAGQSALKALSNFFNTAKLSVTDRATIQNLIVNERLFIASTRIANGEKFPEANQEAFGFVKGARPEKTGYISTDTNDRLYVSPKFLDAWRIKRQLISASNVTLDNNRIYIQPLNRTLMDNIAAGSVALTSTTQSVKVKESAGIPSFGIVDVGMKLKYVDADDFKTVGSTNTYLNPEILVSLYYTGIDYTTNTITLNTIQNYKPRQSYLEDVLGTGAYSSIIKHWSNPIDDGAAASEKDIKYLRSVLTSNVDVDSVGNPTPGSPATISITTSDWNNFPDRGAVTLRENPAGGTYRYSTYVYYKSSSTGNLILVRKVPNASANDSGHTYTTAYNNQLAGVDSKNVFFSGCTTTVSFYDRWAREEPFIPSVESISEDIDLESATLYTVPEKVDAYTGDIDESFVDNSLPNPFSSKALGVNLQNRQAVKKFSPLATFSQAQRWCEVSGFGLQDNVELLLKPGYYKLDGSTFPCQLTINGTGLSKSSVYAGKEQTGTSAGRMGGYLESTVKRGDSIYLYRSPAFYDQYGRNSDSFYSAVGGGLTSKGGFSLNNVHFLGLNDAITKNEILDETYSTDSRTSNSRKLVRKAWYIKTSTGFPASEKAVAGGLLFTGKQSATATGKVKLDPYIHSDDFLLARLASAESLTGSGQDCMFNPGGATFEGAALDLTQNARYMTITLDAAQFTGTSGSVPDYQRFIWARNYIIPGTTMFWLENTSADVSNATPSTKVINVRYVNRTVEEDPANWVTGANSEKIIILVSVYRPTGTNENKGNSSSFTNSTEDLNLGSYVNSNDANMVFVNRDGDEFTTLAYNWCLTRRRDLLPKGFAWAGGYQGAIIKTVPTQTASGTTTLVLNDTTTLKNGDVIFGPGIQSGTTITVSNATTIALSDATTAIITANTKVSFTQSDDFGNVIDKFDTPEIFGIINGYDRGTINLVIDLNPSYDIDSSIRPYPHTDFYSYVAMIMQLRSDTNEDGGVTLPYKYNGFKRITGTTSNRFVLLQVNPGELYSSGQSQGAVENPETNSEAFVDNKGIAAGIMGRFGGFTPFSIGAAGGDGNGAAFSSNQVTFSSASTVAQIKAALDSALASNGSNYNGNAKVILIPTGSATGVGANISVNRSQASNWGIATFAVSGTISTPYNGTFDAFIEDRKGFINLNGSTISTSSTSFGNDEQFIAVAKSNLLAPVCPYLDSGTTKDNAIGKNIYLSWPFNHRILRKRFKAASLPCTGNFCSPIVNVDAIPGSNVPFSLNNCTIGGMSPSDPLANRFGGGYGGGLIRARGSNLSLSGLRVRGNLSLDWTGMMYTGNSRAGGSFTYGHSVELLQMEDENSLQSLGGTNAKRLGVARDDEDFQRVSGFNPDQTLFLEPSKTPYGDLSDADARTFPVSSYQAIRRFNQGSQKTFLSTLDSNGNQIFPAVTIPAGGLLTRTTINERFLTPKPIRYNDLNTGYTTNDASAFKLRWNNSSSSVSSGSSVGDTIAGNELTFLYPVNDAEFVNNIFVGAFASKIVKTTNIDTCYATVTNVTLPTTEYNASGNVTSGGVYRIARIRFSGSIPLTVAAGSNLLFLTTYLTTNRYKYTTTSTSRYEKVNYQGHSNLNLIQSGTQYEIHANIKVEKTGTPTTNLTRNSIVYLHSARTGTTPAQAYLTTDGSGQITTLDFISYGSGHLESDTFTIRQTSNATSAIVTSGITLTAVRNLSENIDMFEPGEIMGVLPSNCFILNSINNPSTANLVSAVKKAKTLFKPGSYVLYGSTYYKIAEDDQSYPNKPYIGVYSYVNESNTADIRSNIVVMLEDVEYQPTYPSNTRFDIFDNDNVLDYWPEKGKVMIGDLELCDFAKTGDPTSNTGYTITLQRDMEQYFPSYIRDWEGLDPLESLAQDVTVGSFVPTSLKLADPVDVSCTGLKRIAGLDGNPVVASVVSNRFITPSGLTTENVSAINIQSDDDKTVAKEKISIGQVVHLPYRDMGVSFSNSPNKDAVFKIGPALGDPGSNVSTNRAGDLRISGKFTSATTRYFNYWYRFQMFDDTRDNSRLFNSVNALSTCKMYWSPGGRNRLSGAGYYMCNQGIRFYGYRWYSLTSTTVPAGSSQVVISSGDTMSIQTGGEYTATLQSGGILNVTAMTTGGLFLGQTITGTGIPANAYISGYAGYNEPDGVALTGRGGVGTYTVSVAGALTSATASSTTVTGAKPSGGSDYAVYYPGQPGYWSRRISLKAYNHVNGQTTLTYNASTTSEINGGSILIYFYGAAEDNVVLALDKALLNDAVTTPSASGNEFFLGENLSYAKSNTTACKTFKTRIIDIGNASSGINIYLADPLPKEYLDNADMRHYGFCFVNYGGWTYPSQGGSSYRANNAALGATNITMLLPNRAGRIQPGDTLSYSYEDDVTDPAVPEIVTYSGQVTNVSAIDGNGYSTITLNTSTNHILYTGLQGDQRWLSLSDIYVSHRTGNFVTNGPVMDKFIYSDTGLKLTFGEYRMWYENINNYISIVNGITGRAGWIGNFALSSTGNKVGGLGLNGASAIQWGRQYNQGVWLAAHPTTPRWVGFGNSYYSGTNFSNLMMQINSSSSIENWISSINRVPAYEGSGTENTSFYPINHSHLTCGSLYAGLNTADSIFGYVGSYDTVPYQWSTYQTKLDIGLQDGVVDITTGNITSGGSASRVTEGLIISHVQHYKPIGWPAQDSGKSWELNSAAAGLNITTSTGSKTVTKASGTAAFTEHVLPGDQIYSSAGGGTATNPTWIGTVASVDSSSTLTLEANAVVAVSNTATWGVVSPRIKKVGINAPNQSLIFSGNSQASGLTIGNGGSIATRISNAFDTPGNNVIRSGLAGFDRYNFAFRIQKRTYNQTPLLNTRGEITPVAKPDDARKVMVPKMGDLSEFTGQLMNVDVTRLNPKTHIERSISVVGSQINI